MPNRGSWNGQWSGQDKKYFLIKKVSEKNEHLKEVFEKGSDSWHYSWGDGWGANIHAMVVDGKESARRRKKSSGFCGYDWMVDTILRFGVPMAPHEVKKYLSTIETAQS